MIYGDLIFDSCVEISTIDFEPIFCNDFRCSLGTTGSSYCFDDNHLPDIGSNILIPTMDMFLHGGIASSESLQY